MYSITVSELDFNYFSFKGAAEMTHLENNFLIIGILYKFFLQYYNNQQFA